MSPCHEESGFSKVCGVTKIDAVHFLEKDSVLSRNRSFCELTKSRKFLRLVTLLYIVFCFSSSTLSVNGFITSSSCGSLRSMESCPSLSLPIQRFEKTKNTFKGSQNTGVGLNMLLPSGPSHNHPRRHESAGDLCGRPKHTFKSSTRKLLRSSLTKVNYRNEPKKQLWRQGGPTSSRHSSGSSNSNPLKREFTGGIMRSNSSVGHGSKSSSLNYQSVLSSSDVLPSFNVAHGLLHPHTVMKLEEQLMEGLTGGQNRVALKNFLKKYKERGPMASLSFLSDPVILPELTKAMRRLDDVSS